MGDRGDRRHPCADHRRRRGRRAPPAARVAAAAGGGPRATVRPAAVRGLGAAGAGAGCRQRHGRRHPGRIRAGARGRRRHPPGAARRGRRRARASAARWSRPRAAAPARAAAVGHHHHDGLDPGQLGLGRRPVRRPHRARCHVAGDLLCAAGHTERAGGGRAPPERSAVPADQNRLLRATSTDLSACPRKNGVCAA